MNPSLISLLSILFGILGANLVARFSKAPNAGLTANTITGVFASILLTKAISPFGLNPSLISDSNNYYLLALLLFISSLGGLVIIPLSVFLNRPIPKAEDT